MEPLNPDLVAELRKHVLMARVIGFALCIGAPAVYLFLLIQTAFHGNYQPLVASFHGVLWGDLWIIVLSSIGVAILAVGPLISAYYWAQANKATTAAEVFSHLRTGHIIHCALLESIAIFGLVLGFVVGQSAGPLCFLMILAPPVGYLLLVPGRQSWVRLVSLRAHALPGGRCGTA